MKPILCIGETKDEYDLKIKNEVCNMQLSKDLVGISKEQMKDVVIAYEPVWAIGTGLVCGAQEASKWRTSLLVIVNTCRHCCGCFCGCMCVTHSLHHNHPSLCLCWIWCLSRTIDDTHAFLRTVLANLYDEEVAQATRIQYGGSVTPESVDGLMAMPEIDGCLVGGASLDADKFGRIINYVKK